MDVFEPIEPEFQDKVVYDKMVNKIERTLMRRCPESLETASRLLGDGEVITSSTGLVIGGDA